MNPTRSIITIDENLCNGCGECVTGCHEGALQLIDGKARLVSELFCDGLGACIGECPVGAITIEERECEPYDELAVMERIAPKGGATILAHLKHLKDHGEEQYLQQGIDYIKKHNLNVDVQQLTADSPKLACGCSGTMERSFVASAAPAHDACAHTQQSELTHWPVQLHLLNPQASYLANADMVLASDCSAFACGDFHSRFLRGRKLAIACPKLDSNKDVYVSKIAQLIDGAKINTLTVIMMEVPCCGGLLQLARMAAQQASRKIPIKQVVVGVQGNVLDESWV